jgi:pilus assembly protein CpaE
VNDTLRFYATGSCDGFGELVSALAGYEGLELVGSSEHVGEAAGALSGGHLDVVLHATRSSGFPGDDYASIREYTQAPVILVASGDCSGLLEEALEDGVADVLPLPQLTDNVVFALRKISHVGRRATGAARSGRIATVFSPKGGTGKTVISVNLATALAKHDRRRTLLLDLDLQFGDAAIMLGIDPEKLVGYTTRHPSGLDILPAPLRPEDAELVTETKLQRLLEVARSSYEAIVVDTSPFFHGPMLATLDRTDELLLVCGMDVPTVKNVRLSLQTLDLLSFPQDRVRIVLNRANSNVGIKRGEIESALDTKVTFELPSDRAVTVAVNRGNPVVLGDPGADFAKSVRKIARDTFAVPGAAKKRRRWFAGSEA